MGTAVVHSNNDDGANTRNSDHFVDFVAFWHSDRQLGGRAVEDLVHPEPYFSYRNDRNVFSPTTFCTTAGIRELG
jgi:hypothetical protein